MGVVYKAEDTRLKRVVALKFLPPELNRDPEARERFIHEAQAASALEHVNICSIHEIGEHEGQTFIVMGYYEGKTVKNMIERGPLPIDEAVRIAVQVAQGLARAHEAGIVHRDIKPANIIVTKDGTAKILDFGLAKVLGRTLLTKSGTTLGTASYMSPEQARGEAVDARTDIWSLGVVFYEMLTGKRPFESDYDQALIYRILNEDPKPVRQGRPEVPEAVEQIVLKALQKEPSLRYQRSEELWSDLTVMQQGVREGSQTIAATEAMERRRKRKRRRATAVTAVTAVVLAAFFTVALPLIQDEALASKPKALAFVSFQNKTGDASLGYLHSVLPDLLETSLEDSRYLRVTRSERMRELMRQIGKDTVEFVDRETGLQLCRRAGIDVMGVGSYTKAGPLFLAEVEVIDVSTGERLGSVLRAHGQGAQSLLESDGILNDLARQISREMGISRLGSRETVRPVAEVTSSSIEAVRCYQRGKLERWKGNFKEARPILELATQKDTVFALAWYELAQCCVNLGDGPGEKTAVSHLLNCTSRLTEVEKFRIAEYDTNLQASLLRSHGREWRTRDMKSFVGREQSFFLSIPTPGLRTRFS